MLHMNLFAASVPLLHVLQRRTFAKLLTLQKVHAANSIVFIEYGIILLHVVYNISQGDSVSLKWRGEEWHSISTLVTIC